MPFTIGGDWVPNEKPSGKAASSGKPVKVRSVRRRNSMVTSILNLSMEEAELKELAAALKKQCGCGGTVKDGVIEMQGDRVDQVREILRAQGIKAQ